MKDVYIIGAARTPIGAFMGSLKSVSAKSLGAVSIKAALQRSGLKPDQVQEVILGNILMAGQGQGPGRQAAIEAGVPDNVPAWAINQLCGSGLKTVIIGADAIKAGSMDCMVAGGMENMSLSPHLAEMRNGCNLGHITLNDSMLVDGLTDVFSGEHMGMTAEWLADQFGITREEQDAYAEESQRRTARGWDEGIFSDEIAPVTVPRRRKDPLLVERDEHFRPETTVESLAKLRPAFRKDGTVTAGNASGINDGAAAVVVASGDFVNRHNLNPLARIAGYATTGIEPSRMGLGPVAASRRALEIAGWQLEDIDRIEANEAFAVQSLAVMRELQLDSSRTNVNGGAIALGHPIGASGARILVTLLYEMKRSSSRRGLATLCVGGGMGVALAVEAA